MLINSGHKGITAQGGFSLIELAIVLVIIGAVVGSFIGTVSSRIKNGRYIATVSELENIKTALYGFAASQLYPHLPCPDCRTGSCAAITVGNFANDGLEDRDGIVCDANADGTLGNLPWRTLGLGEKDAWANRYSYWVSDTVADNTVTGFGLSTVINAATINTRIGETISELTDTATAVVLSHGSNSFGAVSVDAVLRPVPASADELENTDNDNVFVSRNVTEPGAVTSSDDDFEYDDVLIWISEYELKGNMVQAGTLP